MNVPAEPFRGGVEALLAARLRAALEAHCAVWPFDLRPRPDGSVSFDVSGLHPLVARRFELDTVACRLEHGRLLVEFVARGALGATLLQRSFHPVFDAWIPGFDTAHTLHPGTRIAMLEIRARARPTGGVDGFDSVEVECSARAVAR